MSRNIKLSVIIPAYNESENLKKGVLGDVANYLKKQKFSYEVLIVDDGSKDDTVKLVKDQITDKRNFRLIQNPHRGKALAVISGMLKAKGKLALFTDMDQATPIDQITKLFVKFAAGYDVVIGSRTERKGAPMVRKLAALVFSILRNIVLGLPFKDTQCGFKAFNRNAIQSVFPKVLKLWQGRIASAAAVNAGFDIETLYLAKSQGFRIKEVEVEWHHVGTERVQLIKDAAEAIKDIFRIRVNELQGKYNKL